MSVFPSPRSVLDISCLLSGILLAAMPVQAMCAPQARLVHCGEDTCLRISGHRSQPTVTIQVGGHELAVEGGRNWRVMVPLATAREWAQPSGDTMPLVSVDAHDNVESVDNLVVPPGALGRRLELASLVVRAR